MREKSVLKDQWVKDIVPDQITGQSSFTYSSLNGRNSNHAKECYTIASARLRDVNRWNEYAGKPTAAFQLFDETGNTVNRPVQKGDYLRINIPGPDNPDGDGADWVQVQQVGEKLAEERQLAFITVRAASNPLVKDPTTTSHFFDRSATSTFVVYRKQLTIVAIVFGRNEHSNQQSSNLIAKIRNWFIYIGAQLGFANLQWKALTLGLLK